MKWKIEKIDVTEKTRLQSLLDEGWEPFAVTTYEAAQWFTKEFIWLRRGEIR